MDKTIDNWPRRLFYLGIAVVMVLGLLLAPAITSQANAADVSAKWSKVATPYTDDWTVAPGSDILVADSVVGGTVIYVVGSGWDDNNITGNPSNYTAKLWKSEDSGITWDDLASKVWKADSLPAIFNSSTSYFSYVSCGGKDASDLEDGAKFVAVAIDNGTATAVVISDNSGDKFYYTGTLDMVVFSMAVSSVDSDGKRNMIVGGTDGTTGLVYRYVTGGITGGHWEDATAYDGWDNINDGVVGNDIASVAVTKVAFAPSWLADNTVLVVSHTGNATAGATYLQSGTWGNTKVWNLKASFKAAVEIPLFIAGFPYSHTSIWALADGVSTGIALPSDYEGQHANTRCAWVYVDSAYTGQGYIYKVVDDAVTEVGRQISKKPLLASISYLGTIDSGKAIAGLLGDGTIAGLRSGTDCGKGVQVYRNDGISGMDICCQNWEAACKPPTGTMQALVGYVLPSKAYAFVGGSATNPYGFDESAFSFSLDDGYTWNQLGLVDTYIDYLSDVAKSPNCNKTWVVSVNLGDGDTLPNSSLVGQNPDGVCACDSVWLKADPLPEASEYSGAWIREWCGILNSSEELNGAQTPEMGLLRLAPEETAEALTVYLVDRGTAKVYYDSTEGLGCWDPGTSTVDEISDLAVQDEATIYALGFGGDADVAVSDDHGATATWSKTMDSKVDNGHTIAVLGAGNVLVGGDDGKVSYSDSDLATFLDGDASFTVLEDGLGAGNVHVAFDSYFDTNKVVYAAVGQGTPDNVPANGIYRWVIGTSTSWKDLGECVTQDATSATPTRAQLNLTADCDRVQVGYYGIVLSTTNNTKTDATTGGVLYATFYDTDRSVTGVARCLNPAQEVACGGADWDYLVEDTADTHGQFTLEPSSLKICGCLTPDTHTKLWAIDNDWYYDYFANWDGKEASSVGRLWTYEDCFAKAAPVIVSPADNALVDADPCYCWNDAFTLKWERQCDACSYNLQISRDADFTEVVFDEYYGKSKTTCLENDYDPTSGSTPSYVVANGALGTGSCGTTFYWRVRSADAETGEIIHSPWSEVRSLTVATGPGAAVTLTNPSNGAIGVAITGIPFTWDKVADATGYEFSMVKAADGTDVVAATAVSGTTYTYTGTLSYNTSYFWTVKALKGTVVFGQATATFTTGAQEAVPIPPTTPAWVWVVIGIGAVLVIVTLVLIFRTRRV